MSLACLEMRRKRLRLHCLVGRHCIGGLRMCRGRRELRGRLCWGRCVMRRTGSRGSGGSELPTSSHVLRVGRSFTSFASLFLVLALSSCTRTVPTEPRVVNFLIESMPTNLDPRIGTDGQSERIDGLIFDSLVELDEHRNPRGDLAEKWEMPDALTYVFHLRSGVKFHDGRVLTSADVKYTFDSILNRSVMSPKRGSLTLVKFVETADSGMVVFHMS